MSAPRPLIGPTLYWMDRVPVDMVAIVRGRTVEADGEPRSLTLGLHFKLPRKTKAPGTRIRGDRVAVVQDREFNADTANLALRATFAVLLDDERTDSQEARAQRWMWPVMAWTAARIGEIAQLRKADVQLTNGVHWIRITPEAGPTRTGLLRIVPVHPHLFDWCLSHWIGTLPDGPISATASGKSRCGAPPTARGRPAIQ